MKRFLVVAAGGLVLLTLYQDFDSRERGLAVVVDAAQAAAVCRAAGYPEPDFFERLRLMGVSGAALRPEKLEPYIAAQRVLRFTRAEIEKMRAAGVAVKAAPLSANDVWVRDEGLLKRLLAAAANRDLPVSSQLHGGMHVVSLPESVRPEAFPMGYDSERLSLVSSKGLAPVYWVGDPADFWDAGDPPRMGPVFLVRPGVGYPAAARNALARDRINRRGAWLGLTDGAVWSDPDGKLLGRTVLAASLDPRSGLAGALRSMLGRGASVAVAELDPKEGVEGNLDGLRALLRGLRARGIHTGLPQVERETRALSAAEMWARYLGALGAALLGPIIAMRLGLKALRSMQQAARWPEASPVREAFFAALAVEGAAAGAGLVAYALLRVPQWRLGMFPVPWTPWASALPLIVAFLALYVPDMADLDLFLKGGGPRGRGLGVLAAAGAACLLFSSSLRPEGKALGPWLTAAAVSRPSWWWLPHRWPEALVGAPCLLIGFWRYFHRRGSSSPGGAHARAWLFLGMFAPVGIIDVLARAQVPFETALSQALAGGLLGSALGVLGAGLWGAFRRA